MIGTSTVQIGKKKPSRKGDDATHWLITGGCGFIGTNLIRRLLAEGGHRVRVLDNLSVGTRQDLAAVCDFQEVDLTTSRNPSNSSRNFSCELIVNDITDPEACRQAAEGMDVIVHLAANTGVAPSVADPEQDMRANVIGTFNMLEAARHQQVKRFILASSGAPVGECEPPIHEALAPHPVSPYGASKLAGEGYCSAYFQSFGVNTVALRFGNVYGPGSTHKGSVVAKFIKHALQGKPLEIYGDGAQTRDFIYIDDLVRAILLGGQVEGIGGETFQIATNRETTVSELVDLLLPILAEAGLTGITVVNGERRVGDVMRNFSDITKARQRLGWQCEYPLQQGLEKTVAFFLNQDG